MDSVIANLSLISMITGAAASVAFFVMSTKQPEKAKQLRGLGFMFGGIAVLMALLYAL